MAITAYERQSLEKRIVKIGTMIDEIDIELYTSPNPFDAVTIFGRDNLVKERTGLNVLLNDD